MSAECCTRVAVQSLHVVPGFEYRAMTEEIAEAGKACGLSIRVGAPLLRTEEDAHAVAAALTPAPGKERDPDAFVVCVGHGGRAAGNVYARLAAAVAARDKQVLVGTLTGGKGADEIIADLRALCGGVAGRVLLVPLLASVGKHAAEDIAGTGGHSWRGRIAAAGFDCRVELKGLAEREAFARIWLARLTVALDALERG
jgi:sirohydrochlorin cobaltochelatase